MFPSLSPVKRFGLSFSLRMVVFRSAMSAYIFDLLQVIRTDPAKRKAINAAAEAIRRVEAEKLVGKAGLSDIHKAHYNLVAACGMNFGLLTPSLIVKFGRRGRPMNLMDRPFMFAMTCLTQNTSVTLRAGRQVGKCADGNTVVDTPGGPMTLLQIFDSGVTTGS